MVPFIFFFLFTKMAKILKMNLEQYRYGYRYFVEN